MKLKKIKFVENEIGAIPDKITVEMSLTEAVVLVKILGQMSGVGYSEKGLPSIEVYDCLVSDVFNRYFEEGADEALKLVREKL